MSHYKIELLKGITVDKSAFDCGCKQLNNYLQKRASQDRKKDTSRTYVLIDDNQKVIGFYSICATSISANNLSPTIKKKLNYSFVPAILLGQLAVDVNFHGNGYGVDLLMDAFKTCVQISEILGAAIIIVDAINDAAKSFYEKFGFLSSENDPYRLYLTIKKIKPYF